MRGYLKVMRWLFVIWASATFILYPMAPLYGWARPWPEAESALRENGVEGRLIMVGGSYHANYSNRGSSKLQTRTYFAVPSSFRSFLTYTYGERLHSNEPEARSAITQEKELHLLFMIWLCAAVASAVILSRWMKRRRTEIRLEVDGVS